MKYRMFSLIIAVALLAGMTACNNAEGSQPQVTTKPVETSAAVQPEVTTAQSSEPNTNTEETMYQFQKPNVGDEIAVMHTSMGDITIRFFPEQAPKAVENFLTHSKDGYYDGLTFHRVFNEFMIQGGDPQGNGMGGESIWSKPFEDEFVPELRNFRGALSMANSGANTNGSQFFIVQATQADAETLSMMVTGRDNPDAAVNSGGRIYRLTDVLPGAATLSDEMVEAYGRVGGTPHLDHKHTVFGQVLEGMDVVDAIATVPADQNGMPNTPVTIESIEVIPYEG